MARVRMPLTNLKRKLPNIFLGSCVALLLIFCFNALQSLRGDNLELSDSSDSDHGVRKLMQFGKLGNSKHLKRFNLNEDEEEAVCKMPKLSLKTDSNKFAFFKMPPLNCTGSVLFHVVENQLILNETVLKGQTLSKCEYTAIVWQSDDYPGLEYPKVVKDAPYTMDVKHDFFKVTCYLHRSKFGMGMLGKRKLLSSEKEDSAIQHPRHVGSVGMPDPVVAVMPEQASNKRLSSKNDQSVNSPEKIQRKAESPDDRQIEEEPNDEEFEDADQYHAREVYDGRDEYYDNYHSDYQDADFEQLFARVVRKQDVIERIQDTRPFKNSLQMNVLVLGMDSMSHLTYQRKLPLTYSYLKDTLKAVILEGYNIVGDATTAALIPITTGKTEMELPEARRGRDDSTYVDSYPLIWNKFEQSGYVTLFAEDQPSMGVFNLRLNGFEEQPVDHYMRPFFQAMWNSDLKRTSARYCLGDKPEHTYLLDYIKHFFTVYEDLPKFAFGFMGELTHADNNPGEYADKDIVAMLRFLKEEGHLNNTMVIVMGDHGARYSKVRGSVQGKLEERLPLMTFTFPEWFKDKHARLYRNLEKNKDRLTTPFDIYETLRDLLDIKRADKDVDYAARGISLLHEIPANRTCTSAHIDMHWCTCMRYEEVDVSNRFVVTAAKLIVDNINNLTAPKQDLCVKLSLSSIKDAKMIIPNEKVLRYLKSRDSDQRVANFSNQINFDLVNYQLIVVTAPNGGMYESTIQYNLKQDSWQISPDVSRINAYGNQPHCLQKSYPELRKYCYCRNQLKTKAATARPRM